MTTHTQCRLTKTHPDGRVETQTSYIPTDKAIKDKRIALQPRGQEHRDEGWIVAEVFETRPTEEVMQHERDYKYARNRTDV
jgi:hypothetical protein